jgi:hypothetical protein
MLGIILSILVVFIGIFIIAYFIIEIIEKEGK